MADSSQLIEKIIAISAKNPKLIKGHNYVAPADETLKVTSWKMNEFKYYDVPSPFPTLARGLFTTQNGDATEGNDVKYRIIARGYDKFFNIGETPWTNWHSMKRHTTGPYTLTLKSNGCIIFIAAISPSKILVTSKHSVGPIAGVKESHAQVGERWLENHLKEAGKTKEQLAATLWEKKWTAVAELCDDSFEEHVLPIATDMTGLHLHGLNVNIGEFNTQPQPVVDAFAQEWGFIKTASLVLDTIEEVREFTEEIGKVGKWNGEALEGFVVRTTIGPRPEDSSRDTPPYAPGSSFFFKVKFDEPYMMYRDWREITKQLLTAKQKGRIQDAKLSKHRMKRRETQLYKSWVEKEILKNPQAFENYHANRGIIAVRNNFFKWLESQDGQATTEKLRGATPPPQATPQEKGRKTVIVPIGIPGCGKTTVAVALAHLFKFGHTQSDNVQAKKNAAKAFQANITELLKVKDIVIADRNNHLSQHRYGIREAASGFHPTPRLIALYWAPGNVPKAAIHRIASERILNRGDNHQSLTPGDTAAYEDIVWRFIKDSEELADGEVDEVIEMEIEETFEDALSRAVDGLVDLLGLEKPTQEQMGEALRVGNEYKAQTRNKFKNERQKVEQEDKAEQKQPKTKAKEKVPHQPRYYGIQAEVDLEAVIGSILNSNDVDLPEDARFFFEHLKAKERITQRPHITVVHMKSKEEEATTWDACSSLVVQRPSPMFAFDFTHLLWNDRVMALTTENLRVVEGSAEDAGEKWIQALPETTKSRLHVTVGTSERHIPPIEAKQMVEAWREGVKGDKAPQAVALKGLGGIGRLMGLMS